MEKMSRAIVSIDENAFRVDREPDGSYYRAVTIPRRNVISDKRESTDASSGDSDSAAERRNKSTGTC